MLDNVEIVEKIRLICREKGTSLTKLEESLSWSNGYIGKWIKAKKRIPIERLIMVAKQLDVPLSEITGEPAQKNPISDEIGPNKQELLSLVEKMDMPELLQLMHKVTETIQKRGEKQQRE